VKKPTNNLERNKRDRGKKKNKPKLPKTSSPKSEKRRVRYKTEPWRRRDAGRKESTRVSKGQMKKKPSVEQNKRVTIREYKKSSRT